MFIYGSTPGTILKKVIAAFENATDIPDAINQILSKDDLTAIFTTLLSAQVLQVDGKKWTGTEVASLLLSKDGLKNHLMPKAQSIINEGLDVLEKSLPNKSSVISKFAPIKALYDNRKKIINEVKNPDNIDKTQGVSDNFFLSASRIQQLLSCDGEKAKAIAEYGVKLTNLIDEMKINGTLPEKDHNILIDQDVSHIIHALNPDTVAQVVSIVEKTASIVDTIPKLCQDITNVINASNTPSECTSLLL